MSKDVNYISANGLKKLQDEFDKLFKEERPETVRVVAWAASNGDRSENADYQYGKKRLREIDRRLNFLKSRIESAFVIHPERIKSEVIQIGATVTIIDNDGDEKTYQILGVDEVDLSKSIISWKSPLGAALLKGKVGDEITFKAPSGEQFIEILKVMYV